MAREIGTSGVRKFCRAAVWTAAILALAAPLAAGAPVTRPTTQPAAAASPLMDAKAVAAQLADGQVAQAVASLRAGAAAHPDYVGMWMGDLAKPLYDHQCYAELCEFIPPAIALSGQATGVTENFQECYVRSLLQLHRYPEALGAAKGLYNLALMDRTGDAILLVEQALRAAHPEDPEITDRFALQQLTGAISGVAGPTTRPAEQEGPPILAGIRVNADLYQSHIKSVTGATFDDCVERGNLLLLENRADAALVEFKKAYAIAPESNLVAATENLARAMKAQDGAVSRANAWIRASAAGGR